MQHLRLLVLAGAVMLSAAAFADDAPADPGALCDSLAANTSDPDRPAVQPGIAFDDLDVAAAEPACRAAVAAHPDERRYLFELARVLRKKGDTDDAIANYLKAGEKGSAAAYFGLGDLYDNGDGVDQDYGKAADNYRKAAGLNSVAAINALAYLYDFGLLGEDGAVEAEKLYEQAIALGNEDARINLAVLLEGGRVGVPTDLDRAEQLLRAAIRSSDADLAADGKNGLAFLLADRGRHLDEAESLIDAAIAASTGADDGTKASYLDTRGWVRHRAGRDAEAVIDAEAAVILDAESPEYFNRLGDIYASLGRSADAKGAWRNALDLPAPNPYFEADWDAAAIRKKIDGAN